MRLEVVTDINSFRKLQDDWNRLLSTREPIPLPLRHEWVFTWWQVFGVDHQLNIVCIYAEDKLVAIAPFMKQRLRYRGIPTVMQKLMANGHMPYSDIIFDITIPASEKNEIFDLIINSNSADVLQYSKISEEGMVMHYLAEKSRNSGLYYGVTPSLHTPIIGIGGDWDDFVGKRPRNFRKNLNHKMNRYNKAGDFTITRESITSRKNPYLNEMVEISKQSWKKQINNDLGSNTKGREFLMLLTDALGPEGHVELWIMHKTGAPVAFEFHLIFHGVVYPVRADFSENFREFSPGSILEYTVLKTLFAEKNIKEYYSCADDYQYLHNWTNEIKSHLNVDIFARTWKAKFLCALEYKIIPILRSIRGIVSKARQTFSKKGK